MIDIATFFWGEGREVVNVVRIWDIREREEVGSSVDVFVVNAIR
jgi:hypothetical protein